METILVLEITDSRDYGVYFELSFFAFLAIVTYMLTERMQYRFLERKYFEDLFIMDDLVLLDNEQYKDLEKYVYDFPTKHKQGFRTREMKALIDDFKVEPSVFYDKLGVNTGMIVKGDPITYHCDVFTALLCSIEGREKTVLEWD